MLKWFPLSGELQRVVPVPGARPSNVAEFHSADGRFKNHIAIASVNGMILILDANDRVVSAVGGDRPRNIEEKLETRQVFNYTFNHLHVQSSARCLCGFGWIPLRAARVVKSNLSDETGVGSWGLAAGEIISH